MKRGLILATLAACTPEYVPQGDHHQYVVSSVNMPNNGTEATTMAILLGNQRANKMGAAFAMRVPLAKTHNAGIQTGRTSLLLDVQTTSFENAGAIGIELQYGGDPTPPPCNAPPPSGCGQHLKGDASFGFIKPDPPVRSTTGTIREGTLFSDPMEFSIELSFDGESTITVPFLTGGFELKMISEDRIMKGVLGGAIPLAFVQNQLIDEIGAAMNRQISLDCVMSGGDCICNQGSAGSIADVTFDNNRDCFVSQVELDTSSAISPVRNADVMVQNTPAVSFGMEIVATSATF